MHQVFIDTNALLQFYKFTSDDLTQLEKIAAHVESGEISVLSTSQVRDEIKRNREKVIAETIKNLRDLRFPKEFPSIAKGYKEYDELREKITQAVGSYKELIAKIESDISAQTLQADKVLESYFEAAEMFKMENVHFGAAELRMALGRPPGKSGSLGDAINWEILLACSPKDQDLYFVTTDKDYRSPIAEDRMNSYLESEWHASKKSEIFLVSSVEKLFDKFKIGIELKANKEREEAVSNLENSGSFAFTHLTISQLGKLEGFSDDQLTRLFKAGVENNQVEMIMSDPDVHTFFENLFMQNSAKVPDELMNQYIEWFGPPF